MTQKTITKSQLKEMIKEALVEEQRGLPLVSRYSTDPRGDFDFEKINTKTFQLLLQTLYGIQFSNREIINTLNSLSPKEKKAMYQLENKLIEVVEKMAQVSKLG